MVARVIHGVQRAAHESRYDILASQGEVPRLPPVSAYDGQSHEALKKGLDTYSHDNERLFNFVRPTEIGVYTIENASFLIGHDLDGVILTDENRVIGGGSDGRILPARFIEESAAFCDGIHNGSGPVNIELPLSPLQFDSVTLCFDGAWHNYYHWILYGLGRADILRQRVGNSIAYVVPDYLSRVGERSIAYSHATYEGTLRLTGFHKDAIRLPPGQYRAREIKYVWNEPRLPTDILNLDAFNGLFDSVRQNSPRDDTSPKRIYISRERSHDPRMSPEALAALGAIADEYGFVKVFLEEITFDEQVRLFTNVEHIIAPHGAGLANLMLAGSSARVLELNSELDTDGSLRACFYSISGLRQQSYMYLNGSAGDFTADRFREVFARHFSP